MTQSLSVRLRLLANELQAVEEAQRLLDTGPGPLCLMDLDLEARKLWFHEARELLEFIRTAGSTAMSLSHEDQRVAVQRADDLLSDETRRWVA